MADHETHSYDEVMCRIRELRREVSALRDSIPAPRRKILSEAIIERMRPLLTDEYREGAQHVLVYAPIRSEIMLWPLWEELLSQGARLYFPVTHDHRIDFYAVNRREDLRDGTWHILEPADRSQPYTGDIGSEPVICVVPGMVFDRSGHRIGYGGGYYDRFLSQHSELVTIAACYHQQLSGEEIPQMKWDHSVDYIVTDQETICVRPQKSPGIFSQN